MSHLELTKPAVEVEEKKKKKFKAKKKLDKSLAAQLPFEVVDVKRKKKQE